MKTNPKDDDFMDDFTFFNILGLKVDWRGQLYVKEKNADSTAEVLGKEEESEKAVT